MKRYNNEVVLLAGDTHAPYHHKDTLDFLNDVKNFYNPDRVVHMGDVLDIYSVSAYPKDIDHKDSWTDEIKNGRKFVSQLGQIFPELVLLSSNHDDRAYKKSRIAGIPREFLIKYMDVIGAPEGWKLQNELKITIDSTRDKWLFAHTLAGGSTRASQTLGCSVALGHSHTKFGAVCQATGKNKKVWSVDTGCLISDKGSPFSYNKTNILKPIRGCVIIEGGHPVLISMEKKQNAS